MKALGTTVSTPSRRLRTLGIGGVASLLVLLALIGGCGGSTPISTRSSGSTMPSALASAIARTLAASSIEATETLPIDPTTTDGQGAGSMQFV